MTKKTLTMLLSSLVITAACGDQHPVGTDDESDYTFETGLTPVSDVPIEQLCGLVEPGNWRDGARFVDTEPRDLLALPASFDARDHGLVSSVKDQGACGSCWAFSTIATLETAILKAGASTDQSEQYMVSCNEEGWGCNGGWWAFDELERLGSNWESCYPYTASDSACSCNCNKRAEVTSWAYVGGSASVPSTTAIKNAILTYGPVSAAVYVTSAFQSYTRGVFNACTSGQVNHGIQLAGWDDIKGAWLLKNSWNTGWGENGYMWIEYGCNSVGYAAAFVDGVATGDWDPDPDCPGGGGGGCATSVNLPASALTQLDRAVARQSDPRLARLAYGLRKNRAALDQLRRNNPIVENLLGRAMWTNLPVLEAYSSGEASQPLDLTDVQMAIRFARADLGEQPDANLSRILRELEPIVDELHGSHLE